MSVIEAPDRFAQKRICVNCATMEIDPKVTNCADCNGSEFKFLKDLPKVPKHCEFSDPSTGDPCEQDSAKIGRDGRGYCLEHYKASARDLRDALRQAWLDTYAQYGDSPSQELTDQKIIQYFISGLKQTRRTVANSRMLREEYRKVMALRERIARSKIENANPELKFGSEDEEPQVEVDEDGCEKEYK